MFKCIVLNCCLLVKWCLNNERSIGILTSTSVFLVPLQNFWWLPLRYYWKKSAKISIFKVSEVAPGWAGILLWKLLFMTKNITFQRYGIFVGVSSQMKLIPFIVNFIAFLVSSKNKNHFVEWVSLNTAPLIPSKVHFVSLGIKNLINIFDWSDCAKMRFRHTLLLVQYQFHNSECVFLVRKLLITPNGRSIQDKCFSMESNLSSVFDNSSTNCISKSVRGCWVAWQSLTFSIEKWQTNGF